MTERAQGGVGYAPHRRAGEQGWLDRGLSRTREKLAVAAYRTVSAIPARLPLGLSVPVARSLFLLAYRAWPPKRRIIRANAAHVLGRPEGDPEVGRLARRIYATYARYVVELMRLPSRPPAELARMVRADGEQGMDSFSDLFDRLQRDGRSLIAVTGHVGNIEALAAAFAARGWPTYALADDSAYPELYRLLAAQRARWGVTVIAWRNLRQIYRALKSPAILGLLVDWGYRAEDIPVRLFGSWTTLPAGPAMLAARTRSPIVPVATWRVPGGRFEARHEELIEVPDASDASIARATQQVADALERIIARSPEQWYIFKPMWPATEHEERSLEARWRRMTEEGPAAA
jgi:lauroyl/myristoyl acyltransferase